MIILSIPEPLSFLGVSNVVRFGPGIKVRGVHTATVVALVQNAKAGRDSSDVEFIGKTMGAVQDAIVPDLAIPIVMKGAFPFPAPIISFDVVPIKNSQDWFAPVVNDRSGARP